MCWSRTLNAKHNIDEILRLLEKGKARKLHTTLTWNVITMMKFISRRMNLLKQIEDLPWKCTLHGLFCRISWAVVLFNYFKMGKAVGSRFGKSSKKIRTLLVSLGKLRLPLDRLSITFTLNGKHGFFTRDQVSSLLVVYCSLFLY